MRLFAVVPLLMFALVACDDPCEQLEDVSRAKARQCDVEIDDSEPTDDECSEEEARIADCALPCYRSAPCEAFTGEDFDASMELLSCVGECFPQESQ